MYTVKSDNNLLLNRYVEGRKLIDPLLRLKSNEPGSLTFSITKAHPCYNLINVLSSKIKVYEDGSLFWLGRAKSVKDNEKNIKQVVCEGCLAFLNDGVVAPYDFGGSPEEFFNFIIESYNSKVNEDQKVIAGVCTVTDPNDYIHRSSISYEPCLKVIQEKLIKQFGGYLYVTYSQQEVPIINYYAEAPYTCTQLVEIGENLIDYESSFIYDTFYTACIPLGAKDENDASRLTIVSVNDGIEYLVNETLAAQYGMRFAPVSLTTWEDVTLPANLKEKGQDWLDNVGTKHKETVRLNAADISTIKQGVGAFRFLWNVGFRLRASNTVYYVLTQLDIDLNRSSNVAITLGDTKEAYTGLVSQQLGSVASQVSVISEDYTTNGQSHQIAETAIESSTYIVQTCENIISTALVSYATTGDLENTLTTIQSQITQLADSITIQFNETNSTVSNNQESVTQGFTDIYSFIRLIASGVVIGKKTSDIKLKLENDVLYFFTGDETSVNTDNAIAYFSTNRLYVNNSTIRNITLGNESQALDVRILGEGDNVCAFFGGRLS